MKKPGVNRVIVVVTVVSAHAVTRKYSAGAHAGIAVDEHVLVAILVIVIITALISLRVTVIVYCVAGFNASGVSPIFRVVAVVSVIAAAVGCATVRANAVAVLVSVSAGNRSSSYYLNRPGRIRFIGPVPCLIYHMQAVPPGIVSRSITKLAGSAGTANILRIYLRPII